MLCKKIMQKVLTVIVICSFHVVCALSSEVIHLNFGWRFAKGVHPGAYDRKFDDSGWRIIDIPHDWSIEDINETTGPFDKNAEGQFDVGYTIGGIAWYRHKFKLHRSCEGKVVHLQFDGVYMNADVWINNYHVGSRAYGYSTFWFDITPYVNFSSDNTIAVEVKNIGMNSRWYSGSGIYRPVSLQIMDKVHIGHWSPAIRTPNVSSSMAEIAVITKVLNNMDAAVQLTLISSIRDDAGNIVGTTKSNATINAGGKIELTDKISMDNPVLWSMETPRLYTLCQYLKVGSEIVDKQETTFGIRSFEYSAQRGLSLNGKLLLLQGTCMHHDNYMLGAAAYDRAEERRVELTKAAGYNAIRCTHNPPSQAFLNACDRSGILVIDEAFDQWTINKWDHDQDYGRHFQEWWQKDIASMVLRDRNHPCIIMWSIGNEIQEQGSEYGIERTKQLKAYVKELDPTRPVTMGVNNSGPLMDKFFEELDIVGYNYRLNSYESDQARVPDRVSYGSESYPHQAFKFWQKVKELPYIIGDFVWIGWDYLGETSIGWNGYAPQWSRLGYYPWHAAYCGEIDLTGYKRPAAYYRDVLWKTGNNKVSAFIKNPVSSLQPAQDSTWNLDWTYPDIHPSWTWPGNEGKFLEVVVYSACDEAELFLNSISLGRKLTSVATEYKQIWNVKYQPGVLKAVGYTGGKQETEWILKTAGKPVEIRLTADRSTVKANGTDLSYVTAELYDSDGNRVYDWHEDKVINFEIVGEGKLAGIGNANPVGTESFQQPRRTTFRGRCVAVVKSTLKPGSIQISAFANGLKNESITIIVK